MKEKIEQFILEQIKLKEEMISKGRILMNELTKEVFNRNPSLNCIIWTQYRPYFNDGDECTFSVNDATFSNAIDYDDIRNVRYGEYDGDDKNIWAYDGYYLKNNKSYLEDSQICYQFNEFISSCQIKDVMYDLFGDHAEVIATRQGFSIEQYEHD